MENKKVYSTRSVAEAAGTNEVKMLFSPFSPYNCGTDYREEQRCVEHTDIHVLHTRTHICLFVPSSIV